MYLADNLATKTCTIHKIESITQCSGLSLLLLSTFSHVLLIRPARCEASFPAFSTFNLLANPVYRANVEYVVQFFFVRLVAELANVLQTENIKCHL